MRKLFLLTGAVCLMSSCIRQELPPCPPLQIDVTVKDKNYFNAQDATEIIEVKDENLPFKDYVSTLYYIITEAETGKVIQERSTFEVTGSEKNYRISLPEDLPYGKYVVTVWGNLKTERPIGDDGAYENMLTEETLNRDIYVTHDTLDYQIGKELFHTDLERTRGKLLIQAQNVPDYVNHSAKSISNVFQYVGRKLNYAVAGTVQTDTLWQDKNQIQTETLLCPSTSINESKLQVRFENSRTGDVLTPEDIQITMSRNMLTIIRYVYQEESDDFGIYVFVNDNWEKVHGMEVE